jgi:hypothetical protein
MTTTTHFPENRRATFSPKAVLSSIVSPIVWFFNAIGEARITKAQFEVARVIHREYPNEEFNYVFHLLKEGRIGELTLKDKEEIK